MRAMRLAHYSDIHATVAPLSQGLGSLLGKRAAGSINYYFGGRGRHFAGVEHRIQKLLEDVDAQGVDHALCTGDVTQMSYEAEFERLVELYGARMGQPERHTVIPGNHDRYTAQATGAFDRHLAQLAAPPGEYPFVKRIARGVALVGLDVARPAPLLDSSGLCGPRQLAKLEAILTDASVRDDFVIVALHYGLLRASGLPDRPTHGLRDYRELMALLDREDARVDLVLHGHMHRPYTIRTERRQVVCAGSATDLAYGGSYNVYELDLERRTFTTAQRAWDAASGAYVAR